MRIVDPNIQRLCPANVGRCGRRKAGGFSLIEIMISLTIGLIIMLAVVQVFSNSKQTYRLNEGMARIQENGRLAMEFVRREVRQAGGMGCLKNVAVFNNLNGGNSYGFSQGIQGFDATGTHPGNAFTLTTATAGTAAWTPTLDANIVPVSFPAVNGTDVIVIRHIGNDFVTLAPPINDAASMFVAPGTNVQAGQVMLLTDCQKASVFQVTAVANGGPGGATTITHAAAGTPGNACVVWGTSSGCQPGKQQYNSDAQAASAVATAFYIGIGASGRPALYRSVLGAKGYVPQELVDGVENMQILYGVDTKNPSNGNAEAYIPADAVDAANLWNNVVSVRIALLLASSNTTQGQVADLNKDTNTYDLDGTNISIPAGNLQYLKRRVFMDTIQLRNRGP